MTRQALSKGLLHPVHQPEAIACAGTWDVPLPGDMEALIEGLLAEADMAPDSSFCSRAFQADLDAFLKAQVSYPQASCIPDKFALCHAAYSHPCMPMGHRRLVADQRHVYCFFKRECPPRVCLRLLLKESLGFARAS